MAHIAKIAALDLERATRLAYQLSREAPTQEVYLWQRGYDAWWVTIGLEQRAALRIDGWHVNAAFRNGRCIDAR